MKNFAAPYVNIICVMIVEKKKSYDRRQAIKKDITPYNEIYREKFLNKPELHPHPLMYCITSRKYLEDISFICNICSKDFETWSFYCSYCDFDICIDCANNHK